MKTALFSALFGLLFFSTPVLARSGTSVELNGTETSVYFNDGDTFKILTGPLKGKSCRLNGFNTLESYGPIHKWGAFTPGELFENANDATKFVRKGGWHCTVENSEDAYGRLLATCDDMAAALIERGLAHAMSVSEAPAKTTLLAKQVEAIKAGRGMWAKGVPAYILSSVHSVDEHSDQKESYNRAVSTADGHSVLVVHKNTYKNCESVCYSPDAKSEASCLTYVKFENRYGARRALCLRQ